METQYRQSLGPAADMDFKARLRANRRRRLERPKKLRNFGTQKPAAPVKRQFPQVPHLSNTE
jgi:hypothetical protein